MKTSTKILLHIIIIAILGICIWLSLKWQASKDEDRYQHNLAALNDTIKYYKGKNGELVAQKLLFEGQLSDLKNLNNDLYQKIDDLNLENKKLQSIVNFSGTIENAPTDTVFITTKDSILNGTKYAFDFTNKYRTLQGYTQYANDSLKVSIEKDIVNFEYTIAIDDNHNVYINSDNPYVKYDNISGLTIPKQKEDKWSIGPTIGVGVTSDLKVRPFIGVSLTYKVFGF